MIEWVTELRKTDRGWFEEQRVQKLATVLEEAGREQKLRRHAIAVDTSSRDKSIAELPGVKISKGHLTIDFFGTEDLLRQLFELANAIGNDSGGQDEKTT